MPSLLLFLLACQGQAPAPTCDAVASPAVEPGTGNVLLVVIDDVGVEQLGLWGIGPIAASTPTIDCLCEQGIRFTQAYTAPKCTPTRAELLSGVHARRLGLGDHIQTEPYGIYELPPSPSSLPAVATAAGYRTGFFGKWHVATPLHEGAETHPNRYGFERFAGSMANLNTAAVGPIRGNGYALWEKVTDGQRALTPAYPTTDNVDDALAFLDTVGDEPWLVVLSFNAPHIPLHQPPFELVQQHVEGFDDQHTRYLAMLEALDTELGRFLTSMDPAERAETTIVLISDNGTVTERIPTSLDLQGKGTVQEAGVRVPMVVAGPGVPSGLVSDALVHATDIVPTVAELVGVPIPAGIDGISFAPTLADPSQSPRTTVHAAGFANQTMPEERLVQMSRTATHKLRVTMEGVESLHEVGPHTLDEGPDLLAGPLSAEEQAQLDLLRAEIQAWSGGSP